jgi:hypothetical protein
MAGIWSDAVIRLGCPVNRDDVFALQKDVVRFLLFEAGEAASFIAGVGIGLVNLTDLLSWEVRVYVTKMAGADIVSHVLDLASAPVRWIETGAFKFLSGGLVMAGVGAVINRDMTLHGPGTLGAVVEDANHVRYILSCNHVLDGDGDVFWFPPGQALVPIARGVTAIPFSQPVIPADAAIARTIAAVSAAFPPPGLASNIPVNFKDGTIVEHFGGVTHGIGTIQGIEVNLTLHIGFQDLVFAQCALIKDPNFAAEGDSGSIAIVNMPGAPRQATGIVFAQSENGFFALCPLKAALDGLSVALGSPLQLVV